MAIESMNPTTGETIERYDELSDDEIERKIAAADQAFARWRLTSFEERSSLMARAADLLDERKEQLARLMTTEMGKPIGQARSEVEKCAWVCRHYAENAEKFLQDELVDTKARKSFVSYQPLGPVLAIMPWNFPFWQVFRFVAPGLMAGNVGLLKHASNVPGCALAIESVLTDAGFPEGVFQTLLIGSKKIPMILEDHRIRAATLTGSDAAGRDVAKRAGEQLKKVVLELGGSDPFVVMPSADLDDAVSTAVKARTINNGQSCIAAKRFIVHESIYDQFREKFIDAMSSLTLGDPLDESTDLGPLATEAIRDELADQVRRSASSGATIATGGEVPERQGWFYPATVIENIPDGSPAACEETFGPVASLFRVSNIDEAIARGNDTPFGLGASAWTQDESERKRFIRDLDAGLVFINAMVASNPNLPFGGIKDSGFGRELGVHGIHEFVNVKTVWVD